MLQLKSESCLLNKCCFSIEKNIFYFILNGEMTLVLNVL